MQMFDSIDFSRNAAKIFEAALVDEVIIKNTNGYSYKIIPVKDDGTQDKSPFEDIPGIKLDITTQEIVELLREGRAGI